MFKLIFLGVIFAIGSGVLSCHDEKIVIDTVAGKAIVDKGSTLVEENILMCEDFIQKNIEVK